MSVFPSSDAYGQTNLGWGDQYGPWTYRKLHEPELTTVLTGFANPKSIIGVDCVSFQPGLTEDQANQDRYAVEDWELEDGVWKFLAIFDGHAGHETVNYVVASLPSLLRSGLSSALQSSVTSNTISDVLRNTITSFDESLTKDLVDLFPGGLDAITELSDEEISKMINDQEVDGTNYIKVARCMQGSTVLVALVDPSKENIWVASLGDCQAALGINKASNNWVTSIISANHNAVEESEIARVKQEHPGEEECLLRDRVLGGIAITRAVGDHLFKLDSAWTSRIFLNAKPGFQFRSSRPEDLVPRILTPPYLSNKPDVQHINLKAHHAGLNQWEKPESFLVLCSDGLLDLDEARDLSGLKEASKRWMEVAAVRDEELHGLADVYENRALRILRTALGEDADKVAQFLTVEMTSKWLDDITILVVPL